MLGMLSGLFRCTLEYCERRTLAGTGFPLCDVNPSLFSNRAICSQLAPHCRSLSKNEKCSRMTCSNGNIPKGPCIARTIIFACFLIDCKFCINLCCCSFPSATTPHWINVSACCKPLQNVSITPVHQPVARKK